MKKIKIMLGMAALAICCHISVAAQQNSGRMALVQGSFTNTKVPTAYLYAVSDGRFAQIAQEKVDGQGRFAFALPEPMAGFYYVSNSPTGRSEDVRIFLQPGEQVTLTIADKSYKGTFSSEEGKMLDEWQQLSAPITVPAYQFWSDKTGYTTFFPLLTEFQTKAAAFKAKIRTHNPAFDDYLRFLVDNDIESAALIFLYTPRTVHPKAEDRPAYYQQIIKGDKYCDARILRLGDGLRRAGLYAQFCMMESKDTSKNYLARTMAAICNDTLKGEVLLDYLHRSKTIDDMQTVAGPYMKYLLTDSLKSRYNRALASVASYAKGEKAFEFNINDNNGKPVSLKDLRGKVVYIDTWATWCGPCRQELPALKKLEESYSGNDKIAFVSISIDEEKDHQKWLDFIKKEQLGGIQLHEPGWKSEFCKYYKIDGIPRFLLIDPQGHLISADAPRPSDEKLGELLKKALAGNG